MSTFMRSIAVIMTLYLVTGCGGRSASGPGPVASEQAATPGDPVAVVAQAGPSTTVKGTTPVQLYSVLARQVRSCWLNPAKPLLRKHVFRGEAGAGGASGSETSIVIHEQTPDLKRGLMAFSIKLAPMRGGTRVMAQNHKIPEPLGQKFVQDVSFWAQGGSGCGSPVPPAPR